MNILVIDIGGANVKIWKTEEAEKTKFPSGKELTPETLLEGVRAATADWPIERISIGYPGEIRNGRPVADPYNLAPGWVDVDFGHEFDRPVRMMNDACMQALGSYEGGKMLYLGLGTGLGTAFIADGVIVPLALGHLKLWEGETFNHYLVGPDSRCMARSVGGRRSPKRRPRFDQRSSPTTWCSAAATPRRSRTCQRVVDGVAIITRTSAGCGCGKI